MPQSAAEFWVMAMTIGQSPGCCEQLQLISPGQMLDGGCLEQAPIEKTPAQFSQGGWGFGLPTLQVIAGALVVVGEEVLQALSLIHI